MTSRNEKLKEASGNIIHSDPITAFMHDLIRDHLPAGEVEKLVRCAIEYPDKEIEYINGWLAQYAANLSESLQNAKAEKLQIALEDVFSDKKGYAGKSLVDKLANVVTPGEMSSKELAGIEEKLKMMATDGQGTTVSKAVFPEKSKSEEAKEAMKELVSQGHMSEDDAKKIEADIDEAEKLIDDALDTAENDKDVTIESSVEPKDFLETLNKDNKFFTKLPKDSHEKLLEDSTGDAKNTTIIVLKDVNDENLKKWKNTNKELQSIEDNK